MASVLNHLLIYLWIYDDARSHLSDKFACLASSVDSFVAYQFLWLNTFGLAYIRCRVLSTYLLFVCLCCSFVLFLALMILFFSNICIIHSVVIQESGSNYKTNNMDATNKSKRMCSHKATSLFYFSFASASPSACQQSSTTMCVFWKLTIYLYRYIFLFSFRHSWDARIFYSFRILNDFFHWHQAKKELTETTKTVQIARQVMLLSIWPYQRGPNS